MILTADYLDCATDTLTFRLYYWHFNITTLLERTWFSVRRNWCASFKMEKPCSYAHLGLRGYAGPNNKEPNSEKPCLLPEQNTEKLWGWDFTGYILSGNWEHRILELNFGRFINHIFHVRFLLNGTLTQVEQRLHTHTHNPQLQHYVCYNFPKKLWLSPTSTD